MFNESVLGWFCLHSYSTEYIHVCIWRKSGKIWYCFQSPSSVWPFISTLPRLLKKSNTAAYDWSSSTDLHLWFKCQESSPILKCTVVIRLSDSLVRSQERAVVWMYLATASPPSTTLPPRRRRRVAGGPVAELFLPIRTLCTKALKQPPLWHDDNVQFHTASWRLTVYYVCKIFLKMVILDSYCAICRLRKSKSILL